MFKDPVPPSHTRTFQEYMRYYVLYNTLAILLCPLLPIIMIFQHDIFWNLISKVFFGNRLTLSKCKDSGIVNKMWGQPSAQVYLLANALEYQPREGFCSTTTLRCVLRTIPGIHPEKIPALCSGPATAVSYSNSIDASYPGHLRSTVIRGNEGYDLFLQTLRKANDPKKYRLSVNFLRPALFGPPSPTYLPSSCLLGLVGGHHSPVIAYSDVTDTVLVFDVNHNYGSLVISSRELFEAVDTFDPLAGEHRGLVLTEIL